jgi:hypothetical protein
VTETDADRRDSLWGDDTETPEHQETAAQTLRRHRVAQTIEVVAVIILSLATVSSAWSAYEATRWSGEQAVSAGQASAMRTESTRLSNRANTETAVDVQVFTDWVAAVSEKDTRRAEFLEARFRAEFKPAFAAWLASVPAGTIPDGTPFQRPEYQLAANAEAQRLLAAAEDRTQASLRANQISDNFVLTTVLFATVLFFAGIASRVQAVNIRRAVLILAVLVWVAATAVMFTLPQNVGF